MFTDIVKRVSLWCFVLVFAMSLAFVVYANGPTIGVVLPNTEISWYQTVLRGMEDMAQEHGANLVAVSCSNDVSQELFNLESLASRGVDAIVISAVTSAASSGAIDSIVNSGIPVIAFNMPIETDKAETFVGIDNKRLGALAGKEAQKYIDANFDSDTEIHLSIILNSGSQAAADRVEGFLSELRDLEMGNVTTAHGLALDDSMNVMESILQANDKINVVYCFNEGSTTGALQAIRESGRDIAVFGTDMTSTFVPYLRQPSALKAIATQEPYLIGGMALEAAIKMLNGEVLPERIIVPVHVVTPDNIEEYLRDANMP